MPEKQYYRLSKFIVNGGLTMFAILIVANCICLGLIVNNQAVLRHAMKRVIDQRNAQALKTQQMLQILSQKCGEPPNEEQK